MLKNAVANLATDGFEKLMKSAKEAWEEVDKGYDTIIVKTGATGDVLKDLQNSADNVFTSIPVEMDNVGDAIGEINTRYVLAGKELESLTSYFLEYSKINNTQVASSVRNVAGIMKAFQEDTANASKVLDVFTDVGQRTGKDINSLESELLSNSATFKELGLDIRQSAELLGQFEANGVDVSTALSGLKKAQQNATAEGKTLTDSLGETIERIKGAKDETEALQIATDLFGKKGAAAMAQAIQEQRISIDDLASGYEGLSDVVSSTYDATLSAPDKAKIALNKLKIELAKIAETVLPKIEKFIDTGVDNLPKIEQTIRKIIPLIESAATAYASWKIASRATDGVKALSTFAKEMQTTEAAAESLNKVLATGTTAAVALIVAGLVDLGKEIKKAHDNYVPMAERISKNVTDSFKEQREAIDAVSDSIDGVNQSFKDAATNADYEADHTRALWEELQALADESGRVKDADKLRAEYITEELSNALDTEISMTGTQIDNYKQLQTEIDKLIEKKRAAAYIDAYQVNVGEMAQNKATTYEQYLAAYSQEKAALDEFNKLASERYGRTFTPEEFQKKMSSTYGKNDVWNTIDSRMYGLATTAQTAAASRKELQAQYQEISDYFDRLESAEMAFSQQQYDEVAKRLYYQKDANTEILSDTKATADEVNKVYQDGLSKIEAAFTLARESHSKLAKSDVKSLMKSFTEAATASMKTGGKKSGEIFDDNFRSIVQQMIDEGYDISDLAQWGKESGIQIGDVFGDNYDKVIQAQIDEGFDVTALLQWAAVSGEMVASMWVRYFTSNAQRELDSFYETNAQRSSEVSGPLTLSESNAKKNAGSSYGPQPLKKHAIGGTEYSRGIVAEQGPELLEIINGGVRITPLTPTAVNTPIGGKSGDTIINTYNNYVSADVSSDYDVDKLAERLASAEKSIEEGKGR